jgi:hypothetical protein
MVKSPACRDFAIGGTPTFYQVRTGPRPVKMLILYRNI